MTDATAAQERLLTEDRAFGAFLAALVQRGRGDIAGRSSAVHRSFAAALHVLNSDEQLRPHFQHFFASRSTGHVEEFDRALIRGELAGFVHYGNPTYSKIRVTLSPLEVKELLEEFHESSDALDRAADIFIAQLTKTVW